MRRPIGTNTAINRALLSLRGLSIGDQFGEMFFVSSPTFEEAIQIRHIPEGIWNYTDDTEMALSITENLAHFGQITPDQLMKSFALHHDIQRGYGPSMQRVLREVRGGAEWRHTVGQTFVGQGSFGNGSAMRAGPLGAFFALDLPRCVKEAQVSSLVTHTHPEACAGAIAVAIGAALAWRIRQETFNSYGGPNEYLNDVASWLPESEVKSKIERASQLPASTPSTIAAEILGNGQGLSAQDTVPFALWCAAHQLQNYEEALWWAVSAGGDRDTICAMVGSIVSLSSQTSIPNKWLEAAEPYPDWFQLQWTQKENL